MNVISMATGLNRKFSLQRVLVDFGFKKWDDEKNEWVPANCSLVTKNCTKTGKSPKYECTEFETFATFFVSSLLFVNYSISH